MAALPAPIILVENHDDDVDPEALATDRLTGVGDRLASMGDRLASVGDRLSGAVPALAAQYRASSSDRAASSSGFMRLTEEDSQPEELVTIAMQVELADKGSESEDDLSDLDEEDVPQWCRGCCRRCRHSRVCSMTLYIWIGIFVLACFVALVIVGVLVVDPYRRAQRFKDTSCVAVATVYRSDEKKCSCGKGCTSGYSCLVVKVVFTEQPRSHVPETVVYENEAALRGQVGLRFTTFYRRTSASVE